MTTYKSFSVAQKHLDTLTRFDTSCAYLQRSFSAVLAEAMAEWLDRHETEAQELAMNRIVGPSE